jgi:hypothetical protein
MLSMRKELKFERQLIPVRVIQQLKNIRREVMAIKKRQEQILQILEEYELTPWTKKALKEARATPIEKYIPHDKVK